jgi:hypothetical protein
MHSPLPGIGPEIVIAALGPPGRAGDGLGLCAEPGGTDEADMAKGSTNWPDGEGHLPDVTLIFAKESSVSYFEPAASFEPIRRLRKDTAESHLYDPCISL